MRLYRLGGLNTESRLIRSGCNFRSNSIEIKKGAFLNHDVFIDAMEKVTIEEDVAIAFRTMILTTTHNLGDENKRTGESKSSPVTIKRGCWIGAGVIIMPGVTIGEGCVVAAGSVVTKDCSPNSLYAGVPAEFKKELPTILSK